VSFIAFLFKYGPQILILWGQFQVALQKYKRQVDEQNRLDFEKQKKQEWAQCFAQAKASGNADCIRDFVNGMHDTPKTGGS
jgi:hypothetical protein